MNNIFYLIKKFSVFPVFILLIITCVALPLYNHDRVTGPDPYNLSFIFYLVPYLYYITLGSIWTHEQMEEKTKAYEFLHILPLKIKEIVTAKFALIFLLVLAYVTILSIFLIFISPDPLYLTTSVSFLINNGSLCLVLSGLIYIGVFRFGFDKFGKILFILWMVILISPIPINIILFKELGFDRNRLINLIAAQNWLLLLGLCLLLYFCLLQFAIKIKTKTLT